MGREGYITIQRQLEEHWLWQDKPFTKGQAWIDLLFMANFADGEMLVKGKLIAIKRGQVFRSYEYLRQRWGWSTIKKVRGYITLLENQKMVTAQGTPQGTLITIENYSFYQREGQTQGITEGTSEGKQRANKGQSKGNQRATKEKEKKEKEEKEEKVYTPDLSIFSDMLREVIEDWLAYKQERKEDYKPTGLKSWVKQVENHTKSYEDKYIIEVIEKSMASQYRGVVWDWLNDKPKKQKAHKVTEEVKVVKPEDKLSPEEQARRTEEMKRRLGAMF